MRKQTKENENRRWAALENLVDARDAIAMEVMKEVFERLPYGQKFTLSDGSVAYLEKLAAPELCSNKSSDHYQRPHFGFDVMIEGGALDHVEIYAFQTGSGMAMGPAEAERSANANLPKADDAGAAPAPGESANWAASHGQGTGRQSASSGKRARRERGTGGSAVQR